MSLLSLVFYKTMKWWMVFLLAVLFFPQTISASNINCDNRYLTLVNPVRARNLWTNQTLIPIQLQYQAITEHNFAATWLLQDDTFFDPALVNQIKQFNNQQELGLFLEVSPNLAQEARVIYPVNTPWYYPQAIFLSGYPQSDRKKLIDTMMSNFNHTFGVYPKSVGAWWIDSYSLNYLRNKYGVTSAMIVADQQSTDNYGVWGGWWGAAFYPQKGNVLTPASSLDNKLDLVITEWAQRDPIKAYGTGKQFSNYSLQGNDYTNLGLNTDYFKNLTQVYLDCQNPIGQITVGMETGIEGYQYIDEYNNQLDYLAQIKKLQSVTLSNFYEKYKDIYLNFPIQYKVGQGDQTWILTPQNRSNNYLHDKIIYQNNVSFADYFLPDHRSFLNRTVPLNQKKARFYFPWYLIIFLVGLIFFSWKKELKLWLIWILITFSWFGLILHSFGQYGWWVFFGPVVGNLVGIQTVISLIIWFLILFTQKYWPKFIQQNQNYLFLIPLSAFLDGFISIWRYTFINGRYFLGINLDVFRFVGISFNKKGQIGFVNQDFSNLIASSLVKFDFNKIWNNSWLTFLVYPLVHLVIGFSIVILFMKLSKKIRLVFLSLIIVFYLIWVWHILSFDPQTVLPQS